MKKFLNLLLAVLAIAAIPVLAIASISENALTACRNGDVKDPDTELEYNCNTSDEVESLTECYKCTKQYCESAIVPLGSQKTCIENSWGSCLSRGGCKAKKLIATILLD